MSSFALMISYLNEETKQAESFVLDTIEDVQVQETSEVTTFPIVSGDMMSDHMIRQPASLNVRGSFSLNGKNVSFIDTDGATLAPAQDKFNALKDNAIICELVKISVKNDTPRFARHTSMVLSSITWVEKINSLDFQFTFTEVMTSEIQQYDVNPDDQFLPNITDPKTLSFTNDLLDWSMVDAAIIEQLKAYKLVSAQFLNHLGSLTLGVLIGVVLAVGVTASILASAAGIAGGIIAGLALIPVAGWIAIAVIAVAALIGGVIGIFVKLFKKKQFKIKAFEYKTGSGKGAQTKNQKTVERFVAFIAEVHDQFEKFDKVIRVQSITSNEDQECIFSIDSSYYIFKFTKNNTSGRWGLAITDINDTPVGNMVDISASPENYFDCSSTNAIFRTPEKGAFIHCVCPAEDKSDLRNYVMTVSWIDIDKFGDLVAEIIKNAIKY